MQWQTERPSDDEAEDLQRMIILIEEAKAAARTLYELFPDRSAVGPLYDYLEKALRELSDELAKIK